MRIFLIDGPVKPEDVFFGNYPDNLTAMAILELRDKSGQHYQTFKRTCLGKTKIEALDNLFRDKLPEMGRALVRQIKSGLGYHLPTQGEGYEFSLGEGWYIK